MSRGSARLAVSAALVVLAVAVAVALLVRPSRARGDAFGRVHQGERPAAVMATMGPPCRRGRVVDPWTGRVATYAVWRGPRAYELAVFARRPPAPRTGDAITFTPLHRYLGPLPRRPTTLKYQFRYADALVDLCTHRGSIGIFTPAWTGLR